MSVIPTNGRPAGEADDRLKCRDDFDHQQPSIYRASSFDGSADAALDSIRTQLADLGWSWAPPPDDVFTKSIEGETARITVLVLDDQVVLTGDIPGVDFCD